MQITIDKQKTESTTGGGSIPVGTFHLSVQSNDKFCQFDVSENILRQSKVESIPKLEKVTVKGIESGSIESATIAIYNYPFFKIFEENIRASGILEELMNERKDDGFVNVCIASDDDSFSVLDWADWLRQKFKIESVQVRKIRKEKGRKCLFDEDINLLFLLSSAYEESTGIKYVKISNDFPTEISKVTDILLGWNGVPKLKPRILTIARYINKNSLKYIDLSRYNSLHLMMHGKKNRLGLENEQYHTILEWLSGDDLGLIDPKIGKYKFIMLSMCDGANPEESGNTLAFNLIQSGITEYVIGFNGAIGSNKTIPIFMEQFYGNLIKELNVEDAFNRAVLKLIDLKNEYWFRPVLYKEIV